jgi:hypothetical protein
VGACLRRGFAGQAVELDAVKEEAGAEEGTGGSISAIGDGESKDRLFVDGGW